MQNLMGKELSWENNIEVRWKEYFVQLLNSDKISEIGVRKPRIGGYEKVVRKVAGMDEG